MTVKPLSAGVALLLLVVRSNSTCKKPDGLGMTGPGIIDKSAGDCVYEPVNVAWLISEESSVARALTLMLVPGGVSASHWILSHLVCFGPQPMKRYEFETCVFVWM